MSTSTWQRVARTEDVRGPGPHVASAGDEDLVLVRTASGLRAYEGRCPHRGALLGEGELEGGALVCRNHRWRFDLETGERQGGPGCLAACPTKEEDGHVLVDVSALVARRQVQKPTARRFEDLPGPPRLPFFGNAPALDVEKIHLQLERWAEIYGTPYAIGLGPKPAVVFTDMDDMLPTLRDRPETWRRGSNLAPVFQELGMDGVFSAEGQAWRPLRRLSMEALSHRHLRGFYPTLATVAERLVARWSRAADEGTVLDLAEELKRFTVDVTTSLVFGYDIDTLSKDGDVIQEKLGLILPVVNERLFTTLPLWRFLPTPRDREVTRTMRELRDWLQGLVAPARERLAKDPDRAAKPPNFLEAMLVARDDDGKPFDDDVIFANAMTMLLAGEDTTAYTLAWCVHHLLESPRDTGALRAEIDEVMGGARVPVDLESVNRLAFAGAVANEAMRLRPVAPLLVLEAITDAAIGDIAMPKGTLAMCLLRPAAKDEANFAEPDAFLPARWLPDAGIAPHDAGAHQPFGSGPRICPGRTLALLEMKLVLATIYQSFEIERVGPRTAVRERFAFTMNPVGLEVRVRRRAIVPRVRRAAS